MKRVIFLFLFLFSLVLSFDYSAKAKLSNDFYSIGIGKPFYLTEKDTLLFDVSFGNGNVSSLGVGTLYKSDVGNNFSWIVGVEDLFAKYTNASFVFGTLLPFGMSDLSVGILYQSEKMKPYLSFNYNLGAIIPYLLLSDKIVLGLNYGFNLHSNFDQTEYFKMIYPVGSLETNQKTIVLKGYFLDTGKIYLNGEELPIRSDGMFIKSVDINNYGFNDFTLIMYGKSIGKKEHLIRINRKYKFFDLDAEKQKKWEKLFNVTAYPKGNEFLSTQAVTREDFYLAIGRIMEFDNKVYSFKEYFVDVFNQELKDYLYTFYGKGYLRTPQTQFVPEKPILRQEALTVMSRILPDDIENLVLFDFVDVPSKDWFYSPVNKLANHKVMNNQEVNPKGVLTRGDFFEFLYSMRNNFATIKDIDEKQEIVAPFVINIAKSKVDFSAYNYDDLKVVSPVQGERVSTSSFYVKGFAEHGLKVKINSSVEETNRFGRFASEVTLSPGVNKISIGVNEDVREHYVLFLKKFIDLAETDSDSAFIEKVSTLTGYRIDKEAFVSDEFVTKEELILTLYSMGYFTENKVKQLLKQDNDSYETVSANYATAEDAEKLFLMLTGSTFRPSWGEEPLLRKNLVLLLSEIPRIKKLLVEFYNIKGTK